jgi:SAM-dependent MidA family methyltransferase
MRQAQAEMLAGQEAGWADTIAGLPDLPLLAVANEFFDALPVRQFQRTDMLWRERMVARGPAGLEFVWGAARSDADIDAAFPHVPDGTIVEVCPAGEAVAGGLGRRLAHRGGAALVIDYGAWDGTGDTLQALRRHKPVDPLVEPGAADLTAHVRFCALARAAGGVQVYGPVSQGVFLETLGITDRARALARTADEAQLEEIVAAHRRLTHPDEMGHLFQVMALGPRNAPPPPGFAQ